MELDKEKFIKLANEESKCEGIGAISPELLQEMIHAKEIETLNTENEVRSEISRIAARELSRIQTESDELKRKIAEFISNEESVPDNSER